MRDFLAERDTSRNPQFQRRWVDDPLGLPGFQHLGREVMPKVLEDVARKAISYWLTAAGEGTGHRAATAFRQADSIRRKLNLDWADLIETPKSAA